VFPVTRFGAAGDGVTDCTQAFAAAIAACNRAGGGHVIVPPGQFFTGAIHLLSDVDLHRTPAAAWRPAATPWAGPGSTPG
jgi:polygalacturonase